MSMRVAVGGEIYVTHPFTQIVQNLDLNQGLMMKAFFVANNFDRHGVTCTVISALENLAKGAFSKGVNHLVSVREVIMIDNQVISTIIIIAMIIGRVIKRCHFLLAL